MRNANNSRRDFIKKATLSGAGLSLLLPSIVSGRNVIAAESANPAIVGESETNELVAITPTDDGQALLNPGMGWTMHFYSNMVENYGSKLEASDTLDWFPGCSTIYLRLPWSFIEPEEGKFNWAVVDTPAQRWIAKGKKISFRFTCCESWLRWATPEWVHKAGAKGVNYDYGKGPGENGALWCPVYDNPVFLEKLDKFLAEAGRRYNGNPDVEFIDVGTFGMWGEGHTGFDLRLNQADTDKMSKIHMTCTKNISPIRCFV